MTRATTITAIAASAILLTWSRGAGCGSAKQGGKVLVTTETDGSGRARSADSAEKKRAAPEPNAALRDRMLADERRAAEIVKTAMCQKEGHGAAWAAIYALRLGIRHDAGCAAEALRRGVGSDDDLLRAGLAELLVELSSGKKEEKSRNRVAEGRLVLQPGEERRRTGSHYTPRWLSE